MKGRKRSYPLDVEFQYVVLNVQCIHKSDLGLWKIFLDSSMVEHSAVNRGVVGSSPTRGVFLYYMV